VSFATLQKHRKQRNEPEFAEDARLSASVPSNLSRLAVSESFGDFESRAAAQSEASSQPQKKMCHAASAPQLFTEGSSLPGMSQRLRFHNIIMFLCLTDGSGLSDLDGFSLGTFRSTSPERSDVKSGAKPPSADSQVGISPALHSLHSPAARVRLSQIHQLTQTVRCKQRLRIAPRKATRICRSGPGSTTWTTCYQTRLMMV
jgi:hypothetical protein